MEINLPQIDYDKPIFVGNDGSGIKVSNRGEWMRQKWQVRRAWIKTVITVDVEKKKIPDIEVFEKGDSELDIFERHINGLVKQGVNIRKACADGAHDKRKLFNALEKHKIEHAIKHQAKKQCVDESKRLCKQSQRSKKIQRNGLWRVGKRERVWHEVGD